MDIGAAMDQKRTRITVGDVELEGRLNGSATADALWDALPLERWEE